MSANPIGKRGRSSEEEYFRKLEQERLAEHARREARAGLRAQLARALGVGDAAGVETLLDHGIGAEHAAAFEALPLVEVAWADGSVEPQERARLLETATQCGVDAGTPAREQLERWLEERPAAELFAAWHELARHAPARSHLLEAAERIAGAAGGVLGIGAVSQAERRALEGIRRSLGAAAGRAV